MYERSAVDMHARFIQLALMSCILSLLAAPYFNDAARLLRPRVDEASSLSGVVLSEPIATEVKSALSGRLVTLAVQDGTPVN